MKTCKVCGKEIGIEEKYCERCSLMTPEQRKKARPERHAYILYISDLALILVGVAVMLIPLITK